jgi:hypothetical protein
VAEVAYVAEALYEMDRETVATLLCRPEQYRSVD